MSIQRIVKPSKRKYWVTKDNDGNILHQGLVEPNQDFGTSAPVLEVYDYRGDQMDSIIQVAGEPPAFNYEYQNNNWRCRLQDSKFLLLPKTVAPIYSSGLYGCQRGGGSNGLYGNTITPTDRQGRFTSLLIQFHSFSKNGEFHFHNTVDTSLLVQALNIAVDEEILEQSDIGPFIASINSNAGNVRPLSDSLPIPWRNNILTLKEAMDSGLIPLRDVFRESKSQ